MNIICIKGDLYMKTRDIIEEIFNAITHGLGIILSIIGLVLMLHQVITHSKDSLYILSAIIYGLSLIFMYSMSTFYHSFFCLPTVSRIFKILDHAAIYILIAGTDTPVLLTVLRHYHGPAIAIIIWIVALIGVLWQCFNVHKFKKLATLCYVLMGWLLVGTLPILWIHLSPQAVIWLLVGGLWYTLGAIFYLWKKLPFQHLIWHFFVLGGSICHFYAMYHYVLLASPILP